MQAFEIEAVFHVPSFILYHAWLDSDAHTKMTGGTADCSQEVGGDFFAWDGYISGKNLELIPGQKIVQAWRTTDFADGDKDSQIAVTFRDHGDHCHVTLVHTNIPDAQPDYRQGWQEHYFEPMRIHFGRAAH
ncbi:MAG: SRPBCC domain-containing protein [Cryomorphaceae bacterium]